MDIIMVCLFGCWVLLVFFFICYSVTTNKVIKDQETEIETLHAEIQRLQKTRGGVRK
jgi:hypothetical protein